MARVHNLNGTSDRRPPSGYSSWKAWWEARKGRKFSLCSCSICVDPATVGAHVQKHGVADRKWYIVPLCDKCNQKPGTEVFSVSDGDLEAIH